MNLGLFCYVGGRGAVHLLEKTYPLWLIKNSNLVAFVPSFNAFSSSLDMVMSFCEVCEIYRRCLLYTSPSPRDS